MNPDLLSRPLWRGRTNVDLWTILALERAEGMRRHPGPFTVTQGSYQDTVTASAGTHAGGGVVDLRWTGDPYDIVALRKAGFAAWHRTPAQGPWPDHIHAVLGGHPRLAPAAARQWTAYVEGRNGLANNGPDDGPRLSPLPRFRVAPEWHLFTFGTWNAGNADDDQVFGDIVRLMEDADALAVQEMGDRKAVVRRLRRRGFGVYAGDGTPHAAKTVVVWRKGGPLVPLRSRGSVRLTRRTDTGKLGAGPDVVPPKFVTFRQFRHKPSRRVLTLASAHGPASVWAPRRRALAAGFFSGLALWAAQLTSVVFIGMDANAKPAHKLLNPLRRARFRSNHGQLGKRATHRRRAIDHVWVHADRRLVAKRHRTIATSSDHRAVLVDYAIRER